MDTNDFLVWLGNQLRKLVQIPVEDGLRFDAARELVETAIVSLTNMSRNERDHILNALNAVTETNMIGDYQIPYDERDAYDWIEGILATLQGQLEV